MKKFFFLILICLFSSYANAGCDDPLTDSVDYTNCRFSDGQDLQGSYLPNSELSFASFIQVIFDKSIMMNSNLSFGTFPESRFVSANLYAYYCTNLSFYGFFSSAFMVATPHCIGLNWMTNWTHNTIRNMWLTLGTWIVTKIIEKK